MRKEEMIAGMCLYGFIRSETPAEQTRCLEQISHHYGDRIAAIVSDFLGRSSRHG